MPQSSQAPGLFGSKVISKGRETMSFPDYMPSANTADGAKGLSQKMTSRQHTRKIHIFSLPVTKTQLTQLRGIESLSFLGHLE